MDENTGNSNKPGKPTSFRPAQPSHIPDVLAMMEAFYAIDGYRFDPALNEKNLHRFLADDQLGRLWLIYAGDMLIGYLALTFGFSFEYRGRDAFLDELYINENYRGQGIGKLAVDFIIEQAPALGVNAVHLEVERHNDKAIRLYESRGFSGKNRFLLTRYTG